MAETHAERGEVNARIVYWGIEGAGKSTNLRSIRAKLRPDHRGDLREVPTRLDPTVHYEVLPIELGELGGVRTRIEIVAVPGAPEHAPTRKQLLDGVDGVVFVIDATPGRIDENTACLEELRSSLAAYGRSLEDLPLVFLHNKEDRADPYALEELHRKLDVQGAAVFVSVATEGTGVLQALTTISKRVIRTLRDRPAPPAAGPMPQPRPEPIPEPQPEPIAEPQAEIAGPTLPGAPTTLEEAALTLDDEGDGEGEALDVATQAEARFEDSWEEALHASEPASASLPTDWSVRSAGEVAVVGRRGLRIPLVLAAEDGREIHLALRVSLDALDDDAERGG